MVKLRLLRVGRHKLAKFRIIASDSKSKANGAYIENLGHYDPSIDRNTKLKEYEIIKWLANGAQPTDTVKSLLKEFGILSKFLELKKNKELDKYLGKKPVAVKVVAKKEPKAKPAETKPVEKKLVETKPAETKPVESKPLAEKKEAKKQDELVIKTSSKLVSKLSEEEIQKREQEVFVAAEEKDVSHGENYSNTIMISLDKKHVENIINDEKEIVFLKRLPAHPVTRVLLYIVKPIGKVVGEFDLKTSEALSKTRAWKEFGSRSIFSKKEFDAYFEKSTDVKMMEVSGFIQYKTPKTLEQYKLSKGPSGFTYLKK